MRLVSVREQKHYIPPADYLKKPPPSIQRFVSQPERPIIFKDAFLAPLSIADLYRGEFVENSITLQPLALIGKLEDFYTFDNPEEIKKFFLMNDYLIEILLEAPSRIHEVFGEVPIYLELHRDPGEGWEELFIIIKSPYAVEEAARLENKLVEDWFLKKMKDARGKLNLTEEPI